MDQAADQGERDAHGGQAAGHATGDAAGHDAGHAHHGGMSNFTVFMILLIVTVAEVGLAYMDIAKWLKVTTFIVMALYKAVMVAYHFMHLKFERRGMWVIASAPLFLGVLITIGTYADAEKGTDVFKKGELKPWLEKPAHDPAAPAEGRGAPEGPKH
ncbi:MAG: hypothetical protein EXS13_13130 [Planctomycetes bacterium]|nr:hypothetical protein [Planctomycetota bacterium]